jgi:23S rRNA (adenine2503-C2)-methyltransferase
LEKVQLNNLTYDELENFFESISEAKYRAQQLYTFIHKNGGKDLKEITTFSKKLRDKLNDIAEINRISILKRFDSKIDNTKKYLFLLNDRNIIESVAMKYEHGYTICISTQVGCRMGCKFCASTKGGLIRNLYPSEMSNQIYSIEEDLNIKISNIVLMGSGEPLDNYENVLKFLHIIHHEKGHNISFRNITLSTCGIVPKIYDLANERIPITLSISLHSPFDDIRQEIMPIARRYSIEEIIEACKYYYNKTKRQITIEYTLVEGVNDRDEDLTELCKLLKGLNCHVNLIPLNPIKEFNRKRANPKNIEKFSKVLIKNGIPTTIRREMGSDINAACGQLRRRFIDNGCNLS